MFKAFTDWKEGKEFYEYVISRDSSPYLYQQGALYLAKKKRFTEAFSWIDEAILQSNNKILSIRNSHAIILFRTNIIKDEKDPQVRSTLDESMKILAECYTDDKRKTYHALSYADQALQYSNKFRDEIARQYLELSKKWLGDEKKKVPWNRKINFLLKEVNETLTTYKK
jgi:tetratricopeptide (TPR) repeat protein